jgi:uncharacterized protein YwqG
LLPKASVDAYEDDIRLSLEIGNQLLGFRSVYEGELAEDVELLLQVTSEDEAGMEWGDVQDLAFMLPRAALKARDFSKIVAEAGE